MKRHPHPGRALTLLLLLALSLAPRYLAAQAPSKPPAVGQPAAGATAPREIVLPNRGGTGMCPAFTPDSALLLWWDGKAIAIWDIVQEKVIGTIEPAAWQFVVSADGKKLATDMPAAGPGRSNPAIKVYDVATRKEVYQFSRPPGGAAKEAVFRTCGFDGAADKLFTRTDLDLQVWDMKTGKMLRRINTPKPPFNNQSSGSPDGQYLTFEDGRTHVLDTRTEAIITIRPAGADELGKALGKPDRNYYLSSLGSWSFSGDGRSLYGTDQFNGLLLEWALPQAKLVDVVRIPGLLFAKVSADTTRILAKYRREDNKTLRVLDRKTQRVIATLGPMSGNVNWYAISPDNRWVYGSTVGDTRLWDLAGTSDAAKEK